MFVEQRWLAGGLLAKNADWDFRNFGRSMESCEKHSLCLLYCKWTSSSLGSTSLYSCSCYYRGTFRYISLLENSSTLPSIHLTENTGKKIVLAVPEYCSLNQTRSASVSGFKKCEEMWGKYIWGDDRCGVQQALNNLILAAISAQYQDVSWAWINPFLEITWSSICASCLEDLVLITRSLLSFDLCLRTVLRKFSAHLHKILHYWNTVLSTFSACLLKSLPMP